MHMLNEHYVLTYLHCESELVGNTDTEVVRTH